VELVQKRLPDVKLIVFGAHRESTQLALPAGSEFIFQPPQEQIRNIYSRCDVWLCGSRTEGFHLPPLEAMACRCPVVSTRVGGPIDIIKDGINGYLANVDDAEGLADRLIKVLTLTEGAWAKMSEAAQSTAHHYTWDDATDLFEEALIAAVERHKLDDLAAKQTVGNGVTA
jgi:glycosyltransferase involved in cell wall biosynthesis